jgi:hypothetical protein
MKQAHAIVEIGLLLGSLVITGCESKQHKLTRLQNDYAKAHAQYYTDCIAPATAGDGGYISGERPILPTPEQQKAQQQKCSVEGEKAGKLLDQIMAAETK